MLSLLLLSMLACEETYPETCDAYAWMDNRSTTHEPEGPVTVIELTSTDPGALFYGLWSALDITNLSTETDCMVAVYLSETAPSVDDLSAADPTQPVPASIDGVGTLLTSGFLARSYVDRQFDIVSYYGYLLDSEGRQARWDEPVAVYLTVQSCEDPELEIFFDAELEYCENGLSREGDANPDSFQLSVR